MESKFEQLERKLSQMQAERAALLDEVADLRIEVEELHLENDDLREGEALLRALIEETPDAFFVHDLEGRFIFANKASCYLLGRSNEEILKMSVQEVEYGFTPEEMQVYWGEVIAGETIHVEGLLERGDGSKVPVDIRIGLFDAAVNRVVFGIARDISEKKRFEERLRYSHKMEAVGTLAGGIAHDFNNILGIILGCAELGGDPLPEGHPSHEYLKEIKMAVARAKQVVRQLLSFSQKSEETREPMQIEPLVKESLKLMRSTTPANIDLYTSIDSDCFMVNANPMQVHQVIINLCTNAVHATRRGGAIYVYLKNKSGIPADGFVDDHNIHGNQLQLTIRDTGCGMAPDLVERIFDPYFTTKDVGKGSGMGLAVVHGIVQSLGGTIKVVSEIGQGTAFDILFPAIEQQSRQIIGDASEPALPPRGHESILVVDDEASIVDGMIEGLGGLGYRVQGFTSSLEALEYIINQSGQIDLMISDMAMPQMTGETLILQVKQNCPDLPVILCTGYSERVDDQAPEKLGAAKVLLKPIAREELAAAVREVLDGQLAKGVR